MMRGGFGRFLGLDRGGCGLFFVYFIVFCLMFLNGKNIFIICFLVFWFFFTNIFCLPPFYL